MSTPCARRGGERRDDRHRRRDHERARARDDEQRERAIAPRRRTRPPAADAADDERRHDRDDDREHDDGRRVAPREPIDERLHRRAPALRLLDEMDDARERAVGRRPRRLDLERARAVDRPANTVVARHLARPATTRRSPAPGRPPTRPATTTPSTGTRSPGRTTTTSPTTTSPTGTWTLAPSPRARSPSSAPASSSDRIARRARSMLQRLEPLRDAEQPDDGRGLEPVAERDRAGHGNRPSAR